MIQLLEKEKLCVDLELRCPLKETLFPRKNIFLISLSTPFCSFLFLDENILQRCPRKGIMSWQWTTWCFFICIFLEQGWEDEEKKKKTTTIFERCWYWLICSQKGSKVLFLSIFQSIFLSGIRSIQNGLECLLYVQLWVRCKVDEFLQVAQKVKFKGW